MKQLRTLAMLTALVALSSEWFAAGAAAQGSSAQAQTPPGPAALPAPQALPRICVDAQTGDDLTKTFADRLRQTIAASGTLSVAAWGVRRTPTCNYL